MVKKTTRSALLLSVISLLLCVSMLVGATFAWFTDSVSSSNNVIVAGNLDVELYYKVEGQTDWAELTDTTNVFKTGTLWEPGHTEVVKLKIVNEGTLALKYDLGVNIANEIGSVNVAGESFLLSDYIRYAIIAGDQTYTREQAVTEADATATALKTPYEKKAVGLQPKVDNNTAEDVYTDVYTMVVYMPTTVGNEVNYAKDAARPEINLGINLFATQFASEEDSFGSDYDAEAPIITVTPATAQEVLDKLDGPATIKLKAGNYGTLVLDEGTNNVKTETSNNMVGGDVLDMYTRNLKQLTIIGEDGAVVEGFTVISQRVWDVTSGASETSPAHYVRLYIDDLKFENIAFNGTGIQLNLYEGSSTCEDPDLGNIKNVIVEDCSFTGVYGIRVVNNSTINNVTTYCKPVNLTVNDCKFEKIGNDVAIPSEQGTTALYIQYAGDMTINRCTFSEIQYDSIQMAHRSSGQTVITNNTFANTDGYKGYIARAMNLNGVKENAAVIEGNEFYASNSTKSQKYIKAGAPIVIGINTWHKVPDTADFKNVTIDMAAQNILP